MRFEKTPVVVVTAGQDLVDQLQDLCDRNGWPRLDDAESLHVLRTVRRRQASAAVVQVTPRESNSLELILLLSTEARGISIIAAATVHEDVLERKVRAAGAHWYFADLQQTARLEKTIKAVLARNAGSSPEPQDSRSLPGRDFSPPPPTASGRRAWAPSPPRSRER